MASIDPSRPDPSRTEIPVRPAAPVAATAVSVLGTVALVLLIVGGLNWALVGLFDFDLVATLFGDMSLVTRVVYVVVGLAALYALTLFPRLTRRTPRHSMSAP